MAKTTQDKAAAKSTVTDNGTIIQDKVIVGEKNKLSPKEQGQQARGEINEKGEKTAKAEKAEGDLSKIGPGPKTVKTGEKLYQGQITATATAGATGEKVSMRWDQSYPTTEDGLFHSFLAYHPSAVRDTFVVDPSNTDDPTLRTHLEK